MTPDEPGRGTPTNVHGPGPGFLFDGRRIGHRPGQTVGAALVQHDILAWRTTRHGGRPRGLFCGIGVCFDCLVTVDGTPNLRACLVLADEVDEVSTQSGSGREQLAADTGIDDRSAASGRRARPGPDATPGPRADVDGDAGLG